jgi:hypothetical protein
VKAGHSARFFFLPAATLATTDPKSDLLFPAIVEILLDFWNFYPILPLGTLQLQAE